MDSYRYFPKSQSVCHMSVASGPRYLLSWGTCCANGARWLSLVRRRFYHADPHPGNLLKTRDGRLAYIDFGMMGSIEPSVRQALIRATLHLVNREYERLADDFVALGLLPRGSNMEEVIPALTGKYDRHPTAAHPP